MIMTTPMQLRKNTKVFTARAASFSVGQVETASDVTVKLPE